MYLIGTDPTLIAYQVYVVLLGYTSPSIGRMKDNVLFNITLNTFYFTLYGMGHMVRDHSDSDRKPAANTWLAARVLLYAPSHRQNNRQDGTYQSLSHVMKHWLEWEIAQWVHHEGSIQQPIALWADALTTTHYKSWYQNTKSATVLQK